MIDIRKKAQSLDEPPMPPIVPTAPPYAVVVGYEVPMVGAIIEVPTVGIVVACTVDGVYDQDRTVGRGDEIGHQQQHDQREHAQRDGAHAAVDDDVAGRRAQPRAPDGRHGDRRQRRPHALRAGLCAGEPALRRVREPAVGAAQGLGADAAPGVPVRPLVLLQHLLQHREQAGPEALHRAHLETSGLLDLGVGQAFDIP